MAKTCIIPLTIVVLLLVYSFSTSSQPFTSEGPLTNKLLHNKLITGFAFEKLEGRFFLWRTPCAPPPEEGYPVILLFHGATQHAFSWFLGLILWNKYQTTFTQAALDEGFCILALESQRPIRPGPRAWDSFTKNKSINSDLIFFEQILKWIKNSTYPLDSGNLFCVGFSSGAFMCSRIGHTYGPQLNGIVLTAGCNADSITLTMRGPVFDCTTAQQISNDHPSTLIIHGQRDALVPVACATRYYQDLQKADIGSTMIIAEKKGHLWLNEYDIELLDWLKHHMI